MYISIPQYITIKTPDGRHVALLSPEADGIKDVWIDNELNGRCTLTFSLPQTQGVSQPQNKWQYLNSFFRIIAGGKEFIVTTPEGIEISRDGKKIKGKVTAHESWALLGKKFATISNDPQTPNPPTLAVIILSGGSDLSGGLYAPGTAAHALYTVLQGTGWTLGTVDVTGIHDLETEKESVLANIRKIQEIWTGYLVWDSINKTVSLRSEEKWQEYTGYQIRYAKNLKNITRTENNDIITRLYPFGENDLNIASVNEGREYIENYIYTSDVLEGIWHNQDISDPADLKKEAQKYLDKVCRPRFNYKVQQVDLRVLPGYNHEDFSVGHIVDVIDEEVNKTFTFDYDSGDEYDTGLYYADWFNNQVRIIRHRYNVFQPWLCELEVGEPMEKLEAIINQSHQAAKYVNNITNSRDQITAHKLVDESVIAQKIAKSAVDASKINVGLIFLMGDSWTDDTPGGGYVSWNQHKIYWNGKEYNINSGNTNHKYIYWDNEASDYSFSGALPNLTDSGFAIALNNNGKHKLIWKQSVAEKLVGSEMLDDDAVTTTKIANAAITAAKIANAAVGSAAIAEAAILAAHIAEAVIQTAHIADLAVTDAKIANITANKIIASTLAAITANLGTVTAGELYSVKFQSGAQGATSYVEIDAGDSPVKLVNDNKVALELWTTSNHGFPDGSGGSLAFYDTAADDLDGYIMAFNDGVERGLVIAAEEGGGHSRGMIITGSPIAIYTDEIDFINTLDVSGVDARIVGDFHTTGILTAGDKRCYENISQGIVGLFTVESPEVKYEDEGVSGTRGTGEIVNGECRVNLDPTFSECVEPNTETTPWATYLTPKGPFTLYEYELGDTYFIVKSHDPAANGRFNWKITATRKNKAGVRFPRMEWLIGGDEENDPVLEPDWEDELLNGVD